VNDIIEAGIAHAGVMAALHEAAFLHTPWDEKGIAALLAQPGTIGLLDPRGGFLLLRLAADEAEILTIAVVAKRQGVGTALMRAGITQARKAGAAAMYLEVAVGNHAALALYKTLQFQRAGRRKGYYPNGEDAIVLRLEVGGDHL
jgi:ribosomal-protein-alanine N-acetyltransferase